MYKRIIFLSKIFFILFSFTILNQTVFSMTSSSEKRREKRKIRFYVRNNIKTKPLIQKDNRCYFNSILQSIANSELGDFIAQLSVDNQSINKDLQNQGIQNSQTISSFFALQEILKTMLNINKPNQKPDDKPINTLICNCFNEIGSQQDASDFYSYLINIVKEFIKFYFDENVYEKFENLVFIEQEYIYLCRSCMNSLADLKRENNPILFLALKENYTTLLELINGYFTVDNFDFNKACYNCKKNRPIQVISSNSEPEILNFQIMRFNFDKESLKTEKNEALVSIPEKLKFNNAFYTLSSIIFHQGSYSTGHYFCLIKNEHNSLLYDISKISKVSNQNYSEILKTGALNDGQACIITYKKCEYDQNLDENDFDEVDIYNQDDPKKVRNHINKSKDLSEHQERDVSLEPQGFFSTRLFGWINPLSYFGNKQEIKSPLSRKRKKTKETDYSNKVKKKSSTKNK